MGLEIWSGTLSPFSAKVRIALAEKALPYTLHDLPWTRAQLWGDKPRALLEANPRGKVPVLVDGDLAVPDSTVICEYLEERFPETPLLPTDPRERARCRVLEDDADATIADSVTVLIREVFQKADPADRDEEAVADARAEIRAAYARLDAALAEREHLGGDFGLADIAALLLVVFASSLGCPPEEGSRLQQWLARVSARPAVAAELAAITKAAAEA